MGCEALISPSYILVSLDISFSFSCFCIPCATYAWTQFIWDLYNADHDAIQLPSVATTYYMP